VKLIRGDLADLKPLLAAAGVNTTADMLSLTDAAERVATWEPEEGP